MIQNNPNEIGMYPYPGLRPFNDDESIFFKGRDKNIDSIIELLEKNKFVMLTGASGDGKSSLVYAGIVPNARAGLFKAKYNNWIIADFRPERTPLENLTKSLQPYFSYTDKDDLENDFILGGKMKLKTLKKIQL
jgi:energy-coupling factor transporter ATP-binding protein EcfA2